MLHAPVVPLRTVALRHRMILNLKHPIKRFTHQTPQSSPQRATNPGPMVEAHTPSKLTTPTATSPSSPPTILTHG